MAQTVRATALVSGEVQGVGFRYWTRKQAGRLGLAGSATNLPDGRVEVVLEGPRDRVDTLLGTLRDGWTPGQVSDVTLSWADPTDATGFATG